MVNCYSRRTLKPESHSAQTALETPPVALIKKSLVTNVRSSTLLRMKSGECSTLGHGGKEYILVPGDIRAPLKTVDRLDPTISLRLTIQNYALVKLCHDCLPAGLQVPILLVSLSTVVTPPTDLRPSGTRGVRVHALCGKFLLHHGELSFSSLSSLE